MTKLTKTFLICSSVLMALSIATPSLASAKTSSKPRTKITKQVKNPTKINRAKNKQVHPQHLTEIDKIAIKDAKKDFKTFNDSTDDFGAYDLIASHPYYFNKKSFLKPYYKEMYYLDKHGDSNYLTSDSYAITGALKRMIPIYQHLSPLGKKGFKQANKVFDTNMPKRYRSSLAYAKGFILGDIWNGDSALVDSGKQVHPSLSNLSDYWNDKGKVPLSYLGSPTKVKILKAVTKVLGYSLPNAWTDYQTDQYNKKIFNSLHLNKYYASQYKNFFNPEDYDYDEPNTISNIKFGSNTLRHYNHHYAVYYPKDMPGGKSTGNFEGYILYNKNNGATRRTVKNFRKYLHDYMDYHASKDCEMSVNKAWKPYMNWFTKHYGNKNYKGKGENFAQWRTIYNRHQKNSSIRFVVPQGVWNTYTVKN